jgi:hypothetical protein
LDLNLRKELVEGYIWNIDLYGVETVALQEEIRNSWKFSKYGAGEGWKR